MRSLLGLLRLLGMCAATAALLGPLREQLQGQKVVLVFCGSNIDWPTWQEQAILD